MTTSPPPQPSTSLHSPVIGKRVMPRYAGARTIMAMCLREISSQNSGFAGGYLWSLIMPVITIIALVMVFSAISRTPPVGHDFAIFYATGMLPFTMFRNMSSKMEWSIQRARNLLNFPRVTFFDVFLASFLVTFVTQILITVIIMATILFLFDTDTTFSLIGNAEVYLSAAFLGTGVGLTNLAIKTKFPLWEFIWSFATRPLLFISGIIILVESLPRPYSDWLMLNPLVHITGRLREVTYVDYNGSYASLLYSNQIALVLNFVGLFGVFLFSREILDR